MRETMKITDQIAAHFLALLAPPADPTIGRVAQRLAARADAQATIKRLEALALRQQRQRWQSVATLCRLRTLLDTVARCGT